VKLVPIFQVVIIGIITTILAITVSKQAPEFGVVISLAGSILILFMIMPQLTAVINILTNISNQVDIDNSNILIVLKIIGIAYLSEFGVQVCSDAGEHAIASKIELAGKVLIMAVSAPVMLSLLELIINVLP